MTKASHTSHANQSIVMVAIYEVVKGGFALLFALMVAVWHEQLPQLIGRFTHFLHEVMGSFLATQIDTLNALANRANQDWVAMLAMVLGYASLRFVEAYGLYRDKIWAYWLSVLGYGLFLPLELYYLIAKPFDWVHLILFVLNVIIVFIVYRNMKQKQLV
ncbi:MULTISPECIES: DUF2127 domain-containing protein [unclassified Moraxella]|uniref:DUF2127 domain-containing protein n=1 Tax=unclassified Moraxella TaxID=2685852 RepID=UPI003AF4FD9C